MRVLQYVLESKGCVPMLHKYFPWIAGFGLLLTVATACFAIEESKPAPVFTATLLDGKTIDSNTLKGQVVILHFWATWCEACREEMPALDAYYRLHQADGLCVVAVSMDDKQQDAAVLQVMQAYRFPAAHERDSNYKGFGRIWAMPMTFVIDRDGILRKDGSAHPWIMNQNTLENIISPLLTPKK